MPQRQRYKWYANVRRYRTRAGRFVAGTQVAQAVDAAAARFAAKLRSSTQALVDDFSEQAFTQWATQTRRQIEAMHRAVTTIALGGKRASLQFATSNASAWADADAALAAQLRYFDRFTLGIVSGSVPVNNAMAVRAAMYARAAYGTYQNAVRIRELVSGMNEEQRVLGSGNPCADCLVEAALGWRPIGSLRRIGDSVCRANCRCRFIYRRTG